jgi:hypothetical protein
MGQNKYCFKTEMAFVLIMLILGIHIHIARAELSNHVYVKVQSLSLKEYDGFGTKINEESGAMVGIGYKSIPIPDSNSLSGGGEVYFGTVESNGQSLNGTEVEDRNRYTGLSLRGNINILLIDSFLEDRSLMAICGLGLDCWIRSVSLLRKAHAYNEIWTNLYSRMGLGFYIYKNVYISGGAKIPLWTQNHVGEFNLNLNPRGRMGVFFEPTIIFKHVSVDLFYDTNKFDKSGLQPGKTSRYNGWQPASVGSSLGISIHSNF